MPLARARVREGAVCFVREDAKSEDRPDERGLAPGMDSRAGQLQKRSKGNSTMQQPSRPKSGAREHAQANTKGQSVWPPEAAPETHLRDGAALPPADRAAVYQTIFTRRDVRGEFLPDALPDALVARILSAGHRAPSVGLSQPWDFMLVRDRAKRAEIAAIFAKANAEAAQIFAREGRGQYRNLKLEGLLSAPLNICVTVDPTRNHRTVLGATHMPDMQVFSAVCAIQNMWLAARAEGVGMGWVSILEEDAVKKVLSIPPQVRVVGYLTLGYVHGFFKKAELEARGWKSRDPLKAHVFDESWANPADRLEELLDREDALADRTARGG